MSNHYEVIAKYLYDCDWERVAQRQPKHRDADLEIRIFLNRLVVQGTVSPPSPRPMQSDEAVTEEVKKRTRKVSFAPDTPEPAARSNYYLAPQSRSPNSSRSTNPITAQKTFPSPTSEISVPWPTRASLVDWHGAIPVLHDKVTHSIISHCAPWAWVSEPIPSDPEKQAWWQHNVYRPIDLAAKLCALNRQNTLFRLSLELFTKSMTLAAHAAASLTLMHPNKYNPDNFEGWAWEMASIKSLHAQLLTSLKKTLVRREKMVRLTEKIMALARELAAVAESAPTPASDLPHLLEQPPAASTKSLTCLAPSMAGLCAALVPALEAVQEGVDKLMKREMVGDTVKCFDAMWKAADCLICITTANANANGVLSSATTQNQNGGELAVSNKGEGKEGEGQELK
ncbi:hypothetical protein C8A03DRAFT_33516 [Achaetomium macrosporum]|uniref:Uncharacterized protein n=1 Tax=Achaetomium macrosporum TaxID=79813 RepID=A0AAN7CB33_9PEZI|nr:hypothetical protein C8A03DRAFT_33516 [Achaetomium macrosporum]